MKRLFVALPVSGAAREELAAVIAGLQDRGWPVRWARPDGLHLTLKYLGEVPAEREPEIVRALAPAVRGMTALPLAAREIGGFPTLERARVLWCGYDAEPALELLVDRVERALEALGFAVEGRPFRAHVTLGRLREGAQLPPAASTELDAMTPTADFVANGLVLYESVAAAGGSRYAPRVTLPFGA